MSRPPPAAESWAPPAPIHRLLLDTNLLLLPFEGSFSLETALSEWVTPDRVRVPSAVRGELERLVARGRAAALPALRLSRGYGTAHSRLGGDRGLLELAVRTGAAVATGDRRLRDELLASGVAVLSPRGGSRLELSPPGPRGGLPLKEHPRSKSRPHRSRPP
jgi:uncharacterized protein